MALVIRCVSELKEECDLPERKQPPVVVAARLSDPCDTCELVVVVDDNDDDVVVATAAAAAATADAPSWGP